MFRNRWNISHLFHTEQRDGPDIFLLVKCDTKTKFSDTFDLWGVFSKDSVEASVVDPRMKRLFSPNEGEAREWQECHCHVCTRLPGLTFVSLLCSSAPQFLSSLMCLTVESAVSFVFNLLVIFLHLTTGAKGLTVWVLFKRTASFQESMKFFKDNKREKRFKMWADG